MQLTTPTTIIQPDAAVLASWQSNPDYDYNAELSIDSVNSGRDFWYWIGRLLNKLFDPFLNSETSSYLWMVVFLVVLGVILWFLFIGRDRLFVKSKANTTSQEEEDTIYGVDFDKGIAKAFKAENYYEAIRLIYLHAMKRMNDAEIIRWEIYKTPSQYLYEVRQTELLGALRKLTNQFLRIRYGKYPPTSSIADEMLVERQIILNWIDTHQTLQEGGEA